MMNMYIYTHYQCAIFKRQGLEYKRFLEKKLTFMTAFATIISKQAVIVCPFFENIRNMCALLYWHFADRAVRFCVQKRR